jgi:DNA polymerase III epsilon subunit-like protein
MEHTEAGMPKWPDPGLDISSAVFGVLDTETTDIKLWESGEPHRLVEVGAVLMDAKGREIDSFGTMINPGRKIPRAASAVHGIKDRDVAGAPRFAEVTTALERFLDRADILFGFNSPFDLRFLTHEYLLAGREPLQIALFDAARLACRAGLGRMSLGRAIELVGWDGLSGLGRGHAMHSALGDARATAKLVSWLLPQLPMNNGTIGSLIEVHDAKKSKVYDTRRCLAGMRAEWYPERRAPQLPTRPSEVVKERVGGFDRFFKVGASNEGVLGKYLLFSKDQALLLRIAEDEVANGPFPSAKVSIGFPPTTTGEFVLCLYYHDSSLCQVLADKYQAMIGIKYRFWKTDAATRAGQYSRIFLDSLDDLKRGEVTAPKRAFVAYCTACRRAEYLDMDTFEGDPGEEFLRRGWDKDGARCPACVSAGKVGQQRRKGRAPRQGD